MAISSKPFTLVIQTISFVGLGQMLMPDAWPAIPDDESLRCEIADRPSLAKNIPLGIFWL